MIKYSLILFSWDIPTSSPNLPIINDLESCCIFFNWLVDCNTDSNLSTIFDLYPIIYFTYFFEKIVDYYQRKGWEKLFKLIKNYSRAFISIVNLGPIFVGTRSGSTNSIQLPVFVTLFC